MWGTMRYIVSVGKPSEIIFSKVLSLSLHDPLALSLLVQEGMKSQRSAPIWDIFGLPVTPCGEGGCRFGPCVGCSRRWDCSVPSPVSLHLPRLHLPQVAFTPGCLCTHSDLGPMTREGQMREQPPSAALRGALVPIWQGCSGQVVTWWLLILANSNSCKTKCSGEASFYL